MIPLRALGLLDAALHRLRRLHLVPAFVSDAICNRYDAELWTRSRGESS